MTVKKTGGAKFIRKGNQWTVVMTKKRGTVTFTFTAVASGIYLPFKKVVTYRN